MAVNLRLVKPTTEAIVLRVLGKPAPQGSKVQSRWGGMRESSPNVMPFRNSVIYAADQQYKGEPLTCAVHLEAEFIFIRPQSHMSKAKGREHELLPSAPIHCTSSQLGDLEKLARCLCDGLSRTCGGSVLHDDRLVVGMTLSKRYASPEEQAGALVKVFPLR